MSEVDQRRWASFYMRPARVWRHKLDQRLRPLGLSQAKWRTIAHLARGQMTQRDLCRAP
jgi:MarR family transcriptional regulator for hemolysin